MTRLIVNDGNGNGVIFEKSVNDTLYNKYFLMNGEKVDIFEKSSLYYIGQVIRRFKASGHNYKMEVVNE